MRWRIVAENAIPFRLRLLRAAKRQHKNAQKQRCYTQRRKSAALQVCSAGLRPAYFAAHRAALQRMTAADLLRCVSVLGVFI